MDLIELKEKLIRWNDLYRNGTPIVSDEVYDEHVRLLSEINPDDDLLLEIGSKVNSNRKRKLSIAMASMNKLKTIEDIFNWVRLKQIPEDADLVLTPKFDGISLETDEIKKLSTTRGDGEIGQASDEHYKLLGNKLSDPNPKVEYTYGEVVMLKSIFNEKYSEDYANPRNLVSGKFNDDDPSDILEDCIYVKYGAENHSFNKKSELLDYLNTYQEYKVSYVINKLSDLTKEYLYNLFQTWSQDVLIDGIIIEVNDMKIREELGRETSTNNPVWARAYKSDEFEEKKDTLYIGETWNTSKQGYLKPIIHVEPVNLDGAVVSNITGNNARFMVEMNIGKGSILKIKRSGMVIPFIVDVSGDGECNLPQYCKCGSTVHWNENKIELVCDDENCPYRLIKSVISFFKIIEVEYFSGGTITQVVDAGYNTIKKILDMSISDFESLPKFGNKKANLVHNAIHSKINTIPLNKLMHASGCFNGLGSKKLALLEHFEECPKYGEVYNIDGFSYKSEEIFVNGWTTFWDFIKDTNIKVNKKQIKEPMSNELEGKIFVFTGVRSKEAETKIEDKGGKIGSGVSKTTTHLVMKEKGSGSAKETKAIELGIEILTLNELLELLK